jgi:hypothetical protein
MRRLQMTFGAGENGGLRLKLRQRCIAAHDRPAKAEVVCGLRQVAARHETRDLIRIDVLQPVVIAVFDLKILEPIGIDLPAPFLHRVAQCVDRRLLGIEAVELRAKRLALRRRDVGSVARAADIPA